MTQMHIDPERISRVAQRINTDIDAGRYDGISLVVTHRGQVALDLCMGWADRSEQKPLERDAIFSIMSLSKSLMTALTLKLVEDGHFGLGTPIATVLPEFRSDGKATITPYHILTQTSGLPMEAPEVTAATTASLRALADYGARSVLRAPAGTRVAYSVRVAHSVLGAFLEEVTGVPLPELLEQHILRPLGMTDTGYGLAPEKMHRLAPIAPAPYLDGDERRSVAASIDFIRDFAYRDGAVVPGSNVHSTIQDMASFTSMLRTGRAANGTTVLSPATLKFARKIHTGRHPNDIFPTLFAGRSVAEYPANLALGFWGRGRGMSQGQFGQLTSHGTFGGYGRGSTILWVDPRAELTFTALSTGLMNEADSFDRFGRLSDIVASSLSDDAFQEREVGQG